MTVVIPAYEPTWKMLSLVSCLRAESGCRIVIIDDGSGEDYRFLFSEAEKLDCIVLRHGSNRGKGAALKTAFAWVDANEPDTIVCADSDGQHCAEDIMKIAKTVDLSAREMVLGSRCLKKGTPLRSRFGNGVTRFVFRAVTGLYIYDTQTGLRGYPPELLPWLLSVEGDRFEYELNLLLLANKAHVQVREAKIRTIYENRNKGTHFRTFRDAARVYRCVWNYVRKR